MAEQEAKRDYGAEVEDIVDNLTLMDDDLMGLAFDGNIPATERLLRTILGRDDIEVVSVVGQKEYRNPEAGGRTIRLDIEVKDKSGVRSDVEVQRKRSGAHPRRARFHSSMLDARMLREKQKFKELKDSYTIFITEGDYYKEGLPLYTIERHIRENGKDFEDGSHIIYVNGQYDGDDALGKLMHDFRCKQARDMYYPELAKSVRHFKEEEGRDSMCELVENFAKKYAADQTAELKAEKQQAEAEIERLRTRLAQYEAVEAH